MDVVFSVGTEEFSCSGSRVLDAGFCELIHWQKISDTMPPVEFKKGQVV